MRRKDAIAALVDQRGDAITITTEQAIGAWRAAVPQSANEIPDHLDIVGCMGSASTIGLGIALARLASGLSLEGRPVPTLVAPDSVALAFGVAAAIGLFFGIYPAARASRLSPIEALRYE